MRSIFRVTALCLALISAGAPARAAEPFDVYGDGSGTSARAMCGTGDVLVGMVGRSGGWIDQIQGICGKIKPDGTYTITNTLKPRGGNGGAPQPAVHCDKDKVVYSLTVNLAANLKVQQVEMLCRSVKNPSKVQRPPIVLLPAGSSTYRSTRTFTCGDGQAAQGLNIYYGDYVNALGITCRGVGVPIDVGNGTGGMGSPTVKCTKPGQVVRQGKCQCPDNQFLFEGRCQVPKVLPGTNTGDGGGFIQMFPTCAEGKELDETKKKCVDKAPAVTTCDVKKAGDVHDAPEGNKIGELKAKTKDVTLIKKKGANWFNVKWPSGQGWVYSGPGYPNAISCP